MWKPDHIKHSTNQKGQTFKPSAWSYLRKDGVCGVMLLPCKWAHSLPLTENMIVFETIWLEFAALPFEHDNGCVECPLLQAITPFYLPHLRTDCINAFWASEVLEFKVLFIICIDNLSQRCFLVLSLQVHKNIKKEVNSWGIFKVFLVNYFVTWTLHLLLTSQSS